MVCFPNCLIHLFSTFLITLFLISLIKLLYSTFYLLSFVHIVTFSFPCSSYLLNTLMQLKLYGTLQVFLFVYAARNTGAVLTFNINSLTPVFSKHFVKFLRTPILWSTSELLLLYIARLMSVWRKVCLFPIYWFFIWFNYIKVTNKRNAFNLFANSR